MDWVTITTDIVVTNVGYAEALANALDVTEKVDITTKNTQPQHYINNLLQWGRLLFFECYINNHKVHLLIGKIPYFLFLIFNSH